MSKLTNHFDNSKLTATARHLHGQIERLKEIKNQKTNRTIMLKSNSNTWPIQFGEFAGSLLSAKPQYHVENILLDEDKGLLHVEYCQEHDFKDFEKGLQSIDDVVWFEESVRLDKLQAFAVKEKMNHYCRDWADHRGEHQQETGVTPIEYLMDDYDFPQDAVKAYLEAGREVEI